MEKFAITVPNMGESVSEAYVTHIMKENGSYVSSDEEILELETEKVNQVIYAPAKGRLEMQVFDHQKVVPGEVLGYVHASACENLEKQKKETKSTESLTLVEKTSDQIQEKKRSQKTALDVNPVRIKKEAFISSLKEQPLRTLQTAKDSFQTGPKEKGVYRKKMSQVRKIIAKRLVEAKNATAMLTTFNEVDLQDVIALRSKYQKDFQKKYGVKLGFMSFFVKACVAALKDYPDIHAMIDGEDIVYSDRYDIGIAVGTDRGLFVPIIRHCDQKSFAQIESDIFDYAKRARDGKIALDELKGGSFTITNGGVYGSLLSTPIINIPQSAILGMHAIQKRPVVVNDKIEIRPMMYLALSYDHRIVDGKQAVSFLLEIKKALEKPSQFTILA